MVIRWEVEDPCEKLPRILLVFHNNVIMEGYVLLGVQKKKKKNEPLQCRKQILELETFCLGSLKKIFFFFFFFCIPNT